jgi:hypothetical protein
MRLSSVMFGSTPLESEFRQSAQAICDCPGRFPEGIYRTVFSTVGRLLLVQRRLIEM